ncbi:MAG: gluconolaconase [Bryobacteraceae bacterium]|nr:gluconolaconase [Bryobacteraceae bacterium]MDW8379498.1 gluconolaconase [Bryobacterales bacterium]
MAIFKDNDRPEISQVSPTAAIPGGEFQIRGRNLAKIDRPRVLFGDVPASIVIGSNSLVIAKVPEGASSGRMVLESGVLSSSVWQCDLGIQIADGIHPVANPACDRFGNIYTTFSGSRGQKTPVAVYQIDTSFQMKPFVTDMMNPTGLVLDRDGMLYVSSRYDGIVYQVAPSGNMSVYVEGMGVATGMAFDEEENLYVGDRSGTIFKISRQRQIYVFATLEPSIAAYHLAFGPDRYLYVTGPTTSSFDCVYRVSPAGEVEIYYRGLGRPQGIAFDVDGNLYVAASIGGRKGVIRIDPKREASLFLSGPNIVGVAFSPFRAMIIATNNAIYKVDVGIRGLLS